MIPNNNILVYKRLAASSARAGRQGAKHDVVAEEVDALRCIRQIPQRDSLVLRVENLLCKVQILAHIFLM
ncbi:hypothetical protein BK140_10955 [Paenibacillus macerans]|nr:hypothetical protein BK140_10955 [Paenibacillus macerans]